MSSFKSSSTISEGDFLARDFEYDGNLTDLQYEFSDEDESYEAEDEEDVKEDEFYHETSDGEYFDLETNPPKKKSFGEIAEIADRIFSRKIVGIPKNILTVDGAASSDAFGYALGEITENEASKMDPKDLDKLAEKTMTAFLDDVKYVQKNFQQRLDEKVTKFRSLIDRNKKKLIKKLKYVKSLQQRIDDFVYSETPTNLTKLLTHCEDALEVIFGFLEMKDLFLGASKSCMHFHYFIRKRVRVSINLQQRILESYPPDVFLGKYNIREFTYNTDGFHYLRECKFAIVRTGYGDFGGVGGYGSYDDYPSDISQRGRIFTNVIFGIRDLLFRNRKQLRKVEFVSKDKVISVNFVVLVNKFYKYDVSNAVGYAPGAQFVLMIDEHLLGTIVDSLKVEELSLGLFFFILCKNSSLWRMFSNGYPSLKVLEIDVLPLVKPKNYHKGMELFVSFLKTCNLTELYLNNGRLKSKFIVRVVIMLNMLTQKTVPPKLRKIKYPIINGKNYLKMNVNVLEKLEEISLSLISLPERASNTPTDIEQLVLMSVQTEKWWTGGVWSERPPVTNVTSIEILDKASIQDLTSKINKWDMQKCSLVLWHDAIVTLSDSDVVKEFSELYEMKELTLQLGVSIFENVEMDRTVRDFFRVMKVGTMVLQHVVVDQGNVLNCLDRICSYSRYLRCQTLKIFLVFKSHRGIPTKQIEMMGTYFLRGIAMLLPSKHENLREIIVEFRTHYYFQQVQDYVFGIDSEMEDVMGESDLKVEEIKEDLIDMLRRSNMKTLQVFRPHISWQGEIDDAIRSSQVESTA